MVDKFLQWIGSHIMCSGIGLDKRNCPKPEMNAKTFWNRWNSKRGASK